MSPARVSPAQAARAAAEAVRDLNRATLRNGPGAGYEFPSDVYDVVGALAALADRLPQAIEQARAWLDREHTAGRVGHDRGGQFTAAEVYSALACLDDATEALPQVYRALNDAHGHTSHLTRPALTRPVGPASPGEHPMPEAGPGRRAPFTHPRPRR